MTPELYALAAQIITLPGWEWRPGMRYLFATGKLAGKGLHLQNPGCTGVSGAPPDGCVPDLTDDATASLLVMGFAKRGWRCGWNGGEQGCVVWAEGPNGRLRVEGATWGETAARLAVARGGWL